MSRQPRALLRRIALVLIVPVLFVAVGAWQLQRSAADVALYDREAAELAQSVARLEAIAARTPDRTVEIVGIPERYRAPEAAAMLRNGVGVLQRAATVARLREGVSAGAILGGASSLLAGCLGLLSAARVARRSRISRAELVESFARIRRMLPVLLSAQVAGLALALFCAVLFEAAGAWYLNGVSGGALKLIALALFLAGGALYLAWLTVRDLAGALAAFTPDPLPVIGREIIEANAPGLWRFIAGLAAGQHALAPEHVVVGLDDGFFVTSSSIALSPEDRVLQGRTLHIPAPLLALLDRAEAAAVISHELAHFSGEDTAYSQRFLPVYAGIGRSLWAVGYGGASSPDRWLQLPAEMLGLHMMEVFDAAVNHWSRLREFAADQASMASAGADAAASALIRTGAIAAVIADVLDETVRQPRAAPADLVARVAERASSAGLGDPRTHLEDRQPHPTDSHPPTLQRIEALGLVADDALLARAARPVLARDAAAPCSLFADWEGLCAVLSADAVAFATAQDDALEAALQEYATLPGEGAAEIFEAVRRPLVICGLLGVAFLGGFLLLAYALLTFPSVRPSAEPALVLVDAGLLIGVAAAAFVAWQLRRASRTPFLTLDAEVLTCRGLDRPIRWSAVEQADVTAYGSVHTVFVLSREFALPKRVSGWRVRTSARRHSVTLLSTAPRGMTPQAYYDLIQTYFAAARAHDALAARHATGGGPYTAVLSEAELEGRLQTPAREA